MGQNPMFAQQFGAMQSANQQASSAQNWGGFVGAPSSQPGVFNPQGGATNLNVAPNFSAQPGSNADDLMSRTMEGVAKMSFEQRTTAQQSTSGGSNVPMNMMQPRR